MKQVLLLCFCKRRRSDAIGSFTTVEPTDEIIELSKKASQGSRFYFEGIDLLMRKNGYFIGEVNSSPGMESNLNLEDFLQIYQGYRKKCDI